MKSLGIYVFLTGLATFQFVLPACAPVTAIYYRPDPTFGKVVKAWCPPVHSVILTEAHDVKIGFEVLSSQENKTRVSITFEIPEKHTVQLEDRLVEIIKSDGTILKGELSGYRWVGAGRTGEISLDIPMRGYTKKSLFDQITRYGKTEHAYFFLRAEIPDVSGEIFFLKPPRLVVNGVQVKVPNIRFIRTKETYIGSLNC